MFNISFGANIEVKNVPFSERRSHKWETYEKNIGRPTPLSNPFRIRLIDAKDDTEKRELSLDMFEQYFIDTKLDDKKVQNKLLELCEIYKKQGKLILCCYCKPLRCHGDTIKKCLDEMIDNSCKNFDKLKKVLDKSFNRSEAEKLKLRDEINEYFETEAEKLAKEKK